MPQHPMREKSSASEDCRQARTAKREEEEGTDAKRRETEEMRQSQATVPSPQEGAAAIEGKALWHRDDPREPLTLAHEGKTLPYSTPP